jgi:Competence protein CoiA-like family
MFKALHKPSGEEIVSLDPRWRRQLNALRQLVSGDELVCQGCLQPVRLRAGAVKRWHFAHQHLQNCPFECESPVLLQSRAVLYEWLVAQRGEDTVTLEKKATLPRPVDCWVSTPQGCVGYWIVDNRMPPEERQHLVAGMASICPHPVWVFTASMLHADEDNLERLYLTTTEREFMRPTEYDRVVQTAYAMPGASLHYLDADHEELITFRGLQVFHRPQLYTGHRHEHPLSQVRCTPETGGFIHPGEDEALERFHVAVKSRERQHQETERRSSQKMAELFGKMGAQLESPPRPWVDPLRAPGGSGEAGLPKCVYCGQVTEDYWYLNRAENTCKCRDCYRKGSY